MIRLPVLTTRVVGSRGTPKTVPVPCFRVTHAGAADSKGWNRLTFATMDVFPGRRIEGLKRLRWMQAHWRPACHPKAVKDPAADRTKLTAPAKLQTLVK